MQVRIEEIGENGLVIDDPLAADYLQEVLPTRKDFTVSSPAQVQLKLSRESDRVRVVGHASVPAHASCVRCLKEFSSSLQADFDLMLFRSTASAAGKTQAEDETDDQADDDVASSFGDDASDVGAGEYDGKIVLWGEFVREQLLLNLPMQPVCKADCLGLCPSCGVDRNQAAPGQVACGCENTKWDPRWDKLREMKLE